MTFDGTSNKIATFPPNDNVRAFSELLNIKFKQQNPPLHQMCSASLQATQLWRGLLRGPRKPLWLLLLRTQEQPALISLFLGQSEAPVCKGHLSLAVVCKAWSLSVSEIKMKGRSFSVLIFPDFSHLFHL